MRLWNIVSFGKIHWGLNKSSTSWTAEQSSFAKSQPPFQHPPHHLVVLPQFWLNHGLGLKQIQPQDPREQNPSLFAKQPKEIKPFLKNHWANIRQEKVRKQPPLLPRWENLETWKGSAVTIPRLMLQNLHFAAQHVHERAALLPGWDSQAVILYSQRCCQTEPLRTPRGEGPSIILQHNQELPALKSLTSGEQAAVCLKNPKEQNRKWQQIPPLHI